MGKRRGAPLKNRKFTVREASILQRKNERRPFPRNPYLLQLVVESLLQRIEQLDKTKAKNQAKEARALLWLTARHEARLLAPSLELFLIEPIAEEFLKSMGSSRDRRRARKYSEQDVEIGQFLVANTTIQRQLRALKGSHPAHEHLPESLTIQRKIIIDYFEKYPLPTYQENLDVALKVMQAWLDEHLPILMHQLKGIPCLCGYDAAQPIELEYPESVGDVDERIRGKATKLLYRYPEKEILLLLLSHLHQSQRRTSKPRQIEKLLKLFQKTS